MKYETLKSFNIVNTPKFWNMDTECYLKTEVDEAIAELVKMVNGFTTQEYDCEILGSVPSTQGCNNK